MNGREGKKLTGKEKHGAFFNMDVPFLALVNDAEQHRSFMLVEPFLCLVYVIIIPRIRSADDHDRKVVALVQTVVPYAAAAAARGMNERDAGGGRGRGTNLPTGGFKRCEFSWSHLGKLMGGGMGIVV